jgi:hypothetical protein
VTSILGDTVDRAPNRETGDGCVHPRATTETLVQARVAITGLAFIASMSVPGGFGSILGEPTAAADQVCQEDARVAGSPTPAVSSPAVHHG